jgi:hypothetical protein
MHKLLILFKINDLSKKNIYIYIKIIKKKKKMIKYFYKILQ